MNERAAGFDGSVIDIGNTHVRASMARCRCLHGKVLKMPLSRLSETGLETSELAPFLQASPCLIACVTPSRRECIARRFPHVSFLESSYVSADIMDFSLVDAAAIGADRIANALAAQAHVGEPPVIVADCGTAVTLEVVDGNRRFRGGAILPGRDLQRRSLRQHTEQLPFAPLQAACPDMPAADTITAIQSGVDWGLAGAINELVKQTKMNPEFKQSRILITGGDAEFFVPRICQAELAPPDFTLRGLASLI